MRCLFKEFYIIQMFIVQSQFLPETGRTGSVKPDKFWSNPITENWPGGPKKGLGLVHWSKCSPLLQAVILVCNATSDSCIYYANDNLFQGHNLLPHASVSSTNDDSNTRNDEAPTSSIKILNLDVLIALSKGKNPCNYHIDSCFLC